MYVCIYNCIRYECRCSDFAFKWQKTIITHFYFYFEMLDFRTINIVVEKIIFLENKI